MLWLCSIGMVHCALIPHALYGIRSSHLMRLAFKPRWKHLQYQREIAPFPLHGITYISRYSYFCRYHFLSRYVHDSVLALITNLLSSFMRAHYFIVLKWLLLHIYAHSFLPNLTLCKKTWLKFFWRAAPGQFQCNCSTLHTVMLFHGPETASTDDHHIPPLLQKALPIESNGEILLYMRFHSHYNVGIFTHTITSSYPLVS